ncbi:MAG: hypothetical protein KDD45_17580, partial [Bdellovibrionales bacterium]|nr:hypothetical protein [Bdellovibrionales bacterium]
MIEELFQSEILNSSEHNYALASNLGTQVFDWLQQHSRGELGYVTLISLLFIVPRLLLRFGIPMAMASFAMGIAVKFGFDFYDNDNVIPLFSTLGIISLFLFAGMEVDVQALRKLIRAILGHLGLRILVVVILTIIFAQSFSLYLAPAVVLALAL